MAISPSRARIRVRVRPLVPATWADIPGKPSTFPPSAHTHPFTEITGRATLDQLPTVATQRILGRSTTGTGSYENLTVGTGLQISGGALSATGSGAVAYHDTLTAAEAANIAGTVNVVVTFGYSSIGDFGDASYKRVGSEPTHEGKFQSNDGAWWELTDYIVNPRVFGAAGDGSTDDTTAFANLETYRRGSVVDGHGLEYLVDAIPNGNQYTNCDWMVGLDKFPGRLAPRPHVLDAECRTVRTSRNEHAWSGPLIYDETDDALYMVVRSGWRHNASIGSPVEIGRSYDGGNTFRDWGKVWTDKDLAPREVNGGVAGSGKWVMVVTATDAASAFTYHRCVSTDKGVTWTVTDITASVTHPYFGYGPMLNIPNGDGSENANQWIIYGYGVDGPSYIKTLDNWVTVSSGLCFPSGAGFTAVEPWVTRAGAENKWVMTIRDDTGGQARGSTSTDLTTWTTPASTGLPLNANPVANLYDGGLFHYYGFARSGTDIGGEEDKLVLWQGDALDTYNNGGVPIYLAQRPVMALPQHGIGYMYVTEIPDGHAACFVYGEVPNGSDIASASSVGVISTLRGPHMPAHVREVSSPGINGNQAFQFWTRAASFALTGSRQNFADGWFVENAGTGGTITREVVPEAIRKVVPFHPRYMARFDNTAASAANTAFGAIAYGYEDVSALCDTTITAQVWGYEYIPDSANFKIVLYPGGAASPITTGPASFRGRPDANGVWYMTQSLASPAMDGVTLASDCRIEFHVYTPQNVAWTGAILGCKFEIGDIPTAIDLGHFQNTREFLDRRVRKFYVNAGRDFGVGHSSNFSGGNTTAFSSYIPLNPPMEAVPTVVFGGTVTDVTVNVANTSFACNALAVSRTQERGFSVDATLTTPTATLGFQASGSLRTSSQFVFLADSGRP